MKFLSPFLLLLASVDASADCTPRGDAWITLEVVATEIAGAEPVEVIDIDRGGCASIRYASFDVRAGLYRRQLSDAERATLGDDLAQRAILAFDADAVERTLRSREQALRANAAADRPPRYAIADADTYRLGVDVAQGSVRIEVVAPKQLAARHRDVAALGDLVDFLRTLQRIAGADGKTRVAPVTP